MFYYYRVKIDYKEFIFKSSAEALIFAETAILTQAETYTITITVEKREKNDASYIDNEI